jgi:hypothetical protein
VSQTTTSENSNIMGDRSPKSISKKTSQKQVKAASVAQKKMAFVASQHASDKAK